MLQSPDALDKELKAALEALDPAEPVGWMGDRVEDEATGLAQAVVMEPAAPSTASPLSFSPATTSYDNTLSCTRSPASETPAAHSPPAGNGSQTTSSPPEGTLSQASPFDSAQALSPSEGAPSPPEETAATPPEADGLSERPPEDASLSEGGLDGLIEERGEDDRFMAVRALPGCRDGCFPRFPLASFLPLEVGGEDDDFRLPVTADVLPKRILHLEDSAREAFMVEYRSPVVCRDGVSRQRVYYQCCARGDAGARGQGPIPVGMGDAAVFCGCCCC